MKLGSWTEKELELLNILWNPDKPRETKRELMKALDRKWKNIRDKAKRMGMKMNKPLRAWSEEQEAYLRDNWMTSSPRALCDFIDKSWDAIRDKAKKMGLPPKKLRRRASVTIIPLMICDKRLVTGEVGYSEQKLIRCLRDDILIGERATMCVFCKEARPLNDEERERYEVLMRKRAQSPLIQDKWR